MYNNILPKLFDHTVLKVRILRMWAVVYIVCGVPKTDPLIAEEKHSSILFDN